MRILVAAEHDQLHPPQIESVVAGVAGCVDRVTIVAVVAPHSFVTFWAPLSGLVTIPAVDESACAKASEAARASASGLPADLSVEYWTARCWRDAIKLAEEHDALVVPVPPRRRRDRRALSRAARCSNMLGIPQASLNR
jgi:hypothetical protein